MSFLLSSLNKDAFFFVRVMDVTQTISFSSLQGTSFLVLFGLPGFKHEHEACHAVQCAGQIKDVVSAMIEVK